MDSQLGPEESVYRPARARSASGVYCRRGHALSPTTGHAPPSTTGLRGSGRAARAAPSLCPSHVQPYVCSRGQCDELHICRLFLDGFCPREFTACRWGHTVKSADNWGALETYQLQAVSEHELLWLTRSLMQRTMPVSIEEYRRELTLCKQYSANAHCVRKDCFRMHLCPRLVEGTCQAGSSCRWTHGLNDPDNVMVLLRLKCAGLAERELLARLARRLDSEHETVGSSSGVSSELTTASPVSGGAAGSSHSGVGSGDGKGSAEPRGDNISHRDHVTWTSTPLKSTVHPQADESVVLAASLMSSLDLCPQNVHPSKCLDSACMKLHLCRLYVAGMCPYGDSCSSGHKPFESAHNGNVLRRHMLLNVSEAELFKVLQEGYLTRYPILVQERHMALQGCRPYQRGCCSQSDCARLHICFRYVQGTCEDCNSCGLSHELDAPAQAEIIRRIGLDSLSAGELLDILRNPVLSKDVHQALVSGSAEGASEGQDPLPQIQIQSRSLSLSHVPPSLPAPLDCCDIQRQADSQTGGIPPETGSALEVNATHKSASKPSLDIASDGSSLDLCPQNTRPDICLDEGCEKLHVCRYFVAGMCPYGKGCGRGHLLCISERDRGILERHHIKYISKGDLLKSLSSGYLARNPLTAVERQFLLQLCFPYQTGSCEEKVCPRLHICSAYVLGTCRRGCGLSHQISSPSHAVIIRRLGLSSLPFKDILKILRDSIKDTEHCTSLQEHVVPSDPVENDRSESLGELSVYDASRGSCPSGSSTTQNSEQEDTDPEDMASCCSYSTRPDSSASDGQSEKLEERFAHDATQEPYSSRASATQNWAQEAADTNDAASCSSHASQPDACTSDGQSPMQCDVRPSNPVKDDQLENLDGHSARDVPQESCSSQVSTTENSTHEVADAADMISCSPHETHPGTSANDGPTLCDVHSSGGCCDQADCCGFHVCGYYLADVCRRSDELCPFGHTFMTEHNVRVMQILGLMGGSADDFQKLLDMIVLQARITFRNDAQKEVEFCFGYNSSSGCTEADDCKQFHVCHRFLGGTCHESDCGLLHRLSGDHNERVRAALGVASSNPSEDPDVIWATDRELMELLRAKMSLNPGIYPTERSETLSPITTDSSPNVETSWTAVDGHTILPKLPAVCQLYGTTAGCSDKKCAFVHICPHFLASSCHKPPCTLKHRLGTLRNREVLCRAGWIVTDANHKEFVKMLYDSSLHVRRTEVYARLRLCKDYNSKGCTTGNCKSIHICQKFILGSCKKTKHCRKGHTVRREDLSKLQAVGLQDASTDEVIEMLRAIHTNSLVPLASSL